MNRIALSLALTTGLALLSACSSTGGHLRPEAKRNMALVKKAVRVSMQEPRQDAVRQIWSPSYIQHSPIQPSGLQPILDWVGYMEKNGKGAFSYELHRQLVDDDLVALHGRVVGLGPEPSVLFNVFRVEDGQLAEHWEGMQPIVTPSLSGRTMLDGPDLPTDLHLTEENKALVAEFMQRVLVEGDGASMASYFDGDSYLQHNPMIADGVANLRAGLAQMAANGAALEVVKVHRLIGMGNFVLAHSEGSLGGKRHQFFDLFRVKDGKIAEHWDCIQDISGGSKNSNGVF